MPGFASGKGLARHSGALITETSPMSKVDEALEQFRGDKARYCIVLVNGRGGAVSRCRPLC